MSRTPKGRRRSPSSGRPQRARRPDRTLLWILVALGVILLVSLFRAKHLGFPLERDEGEFGYIAQEILRGVPVYESAYTQKLPGTYLVYALLLALFGQSIAAIHIGLLLTNAIIMGLIFLTLRKTDNGLSGCIGALVYGVMALSPSVVGFAAHATFFVTLFAMAGLYVLLYAREPGQIPLFLVSGLCFGLAFLMKQSGIIFAPVALAILAFDHLAVRPRQPARFARQALTLGAGALVPFLLTAAYYVVIGEFSRFWFWTFRFAGALSGRVGFADAIRNLHDRTMGVTAGFEIMWGLALVGLVATLRDVTLGKNRYLYAAFGVACILSVVPGFFFTNHYYITALAAVALLNGALAGSVMRGARSGRFAQVAGVWILIGVGLLVGVARYKAYYFGWVADVTVSRWLYDGNPFTESIAIGEYLKRHTTPEDRIAILGSETQILFYAQRRSPSRFVNAYFLTAVHPRARGMQHEMIRDIERAGPKYIVFARFPQSWLMLPQSHSDILDWFGKYGREHYELEGILLMSEGGNVLKWGEDARAQPPTDKRVEILRKIDSNRVPG
jgi:4-amino-4-deoxy-L-arabinose transferase-like glycosyltransferase